MTKVPVKIDLSSPDAVVIDGLALRNVSGLFFTARHDDVAVLELSLALHPGGITVEADAEVTLDPDTVAVLQRLGWRPPS